MGIVISQKCLTFLDIALLDKVRKLSKSVSFPTQLQVACRPQGFLQICPAEYTHPLEKRARGVQPNSLRNYAKMDGVYAVLQQL